MFEVIEEKINELNRIATNFKKSINKCYKPETLLAKRAQVQELFIQIQNLIRSNSDLTQLQHDCFITFANESYQSTLEIINKKLESGNFFKIKFKNIVNRIIITNRKHKMALNIETASKIAELIPNYDGGPEGAKSFTDAINFLDGVVTAAQKPGTIQLALTKLTGKARELFTEVPADLATIVTKITENCVDKTSADLALSNLQNLRLRNDVQKFTAEVEKLCDKLTRAYVREQIPAEAARKLSQKAAVKTMINQAQSTETKMMLKIGKFDTLKDACNILIENENTSTTTSQILQAGNQTNRRFDNAPRNFKQYSSRREYENHTNRNRSFDRFRNRNFNERRPVNRDFYQRGNRGNGNYRGRGYGQNRHQNYGHQNGNSRVYCANEQPQSGNVVHNNTANQAPPTCAHVGVVQSNQQSQPSQMQQHFLGQRM